MNNIRHLKTKQSREQVAITQSTTRDVQRWLPLRWHTAFLYLCILYLCFVFVCLCVCVFVYLRIFVFLWIRPAQFEKLPRSEFDPELSPHSPYVKFFATFVTKVPYLTFCDKIRQFWYRKWIDGEEKQRGKYSEWISFYFFILSPFPLHFLILSPFPRILDARMQRVAQPCYEYLSWFLLWLCKGNALEHKSQMHWDKTFLKVQFVFA